MPTIAMREMCALCGRVVRVGFHVPNEIWQGVVHPSQINSIHCIDCFTTRADEKLVEWDKEIKFYPVSLSSHLNRTGELEDLRGLYAIVHAQRDRLAAEVRELRVQSEYYFQKARTSK